DLPAVEGAAAAPPANRLAGGHHALAHILAAAAAHVGQGLAVGALRLVVAPALGARELAADEDLVGLHHRQAISLGRCSRRRLLEVTVGLVAVDTGSILGGLGKGLCHGVRFRAKATPRPHMRLRYRSTTKRRVLRL